MITKLLFRPPIFFFIRLRDPFVLQGCRIFLNMESTTTLNTYVCALNVIEVSESYHRVVLKFNSSILS